MRAQYKINFDRPPRLKKLPEALIISPELRHLYIHTYQRRLGDYTGMHCGQAHFVTYYRFLGSARHCSVAFAEVRTGELTGEVFQYICN